MARGPRHSLPMRYSAPYLLAPSPFPTYREYNTLIVYE